MSADNFTYEAKESGFTDEPTPEGQLRLIRDAQDKFAALPTEQVYAYMLVVMSPPDTDGNIDMRCESAGEPWDKEMMLKALTDSTMRQLALQKARLQGSDDDAESDDN